jgi:type I restriction enzyme R subunit
MMVAFFFLNLKTQLELFNETTFTAREFDAVLNHLAKGNLFEKAKTLRDRFQLTKENGESFYVRFFNSEDWSKNEYQVTNQVQQEGSFIEILDYSHPPYWIMLTPCSGQIDPGS